MGTTRQQRSGFLVGLTGIVFGLSLNALAFSPTDLPLGIQGDENIDILIPGLPAIRSGHTVCDDSRRGKLVMFGGLSSYTTYMTMEWMGSTGVVLT